MHTPLKRYIRLAKVLMSPQDEKWSCTGFSTDSYTFCLLIIFLVVVPLVLTLTLTPVIHPEGPLKSGRVFHSTLVQSLIWIFLYCQNLENQDNGNASALKTSIFQGPCHYTIVLLRL